MTTRQILTAAKARIANPEHWCQRAFAMTTAGKATLPRSPGAVRWCVSGSLMLSSDTDQEGYWLLRRRAIAAGFRDVAHLNDTGTHADVMAVLDAAIKEAGAHSRAKAPR